MNRTVVEWRAKLEQHERDVRARDIAAGSRLLPLEVRHELEGDMVERWGAGGPTDAMLQDLMELWSQKSGYTGASIEIQQIWHTLICQRTPSLYELVKLRRFHRDWWSWTQNRKRSSFLRDMNDKQPDLFSIVRSSASARRLQERLNQHFSTAHQQHPHEDDFSCVLTDPARETDTMFRINTIRTIDGYVGQVIYNESDLVVWQDKEAFNEEIEVKGVVKSPNQQATEAAMAKRDEVMAELFTDKPFQRAKSR